MSYLEHFTEITSLGSQEILDFVKSAPHRYKQYTIPKRNGRGVRLIAQPSKEVKYMQYIGKQLILDELPVHSAAYAYQKRTSIKANASQHIANKYLLKMDFSDFFPSIKPPLLLGVLQRQVGELSADDITLIKRLFFWQRDRMSPLQLSIGAPSSPLISNVIMYDFDEYLYSYCTQRGISYTRYADDLSFSTNERGLLFHIPEVVSNYLSTNEHLGLSINTTKTKFSSKKHNRHVTGLVINNDDQLSLGRKRKRKIRTLVYLFTQSALETDEVFHLKGLLAFASNIEPEFILRLKSKFSNEVVDSIWRYQE
ncbi:retron St85 family RNA-directed DNA polymerase [Vibrio parahaemolyticus]|uniref:retron St85 family RNA-directed DNA polymerase n=1 Tax=Vibrio parahaemolyticus TaxID=670 RepID=UPI001E55A433|nr:retron St85 family RNA-directed DNA polymerase [Vibrio parahaemolyticus]HCG5064969.1 retron St85 family RNA-directed DNA polymerase [Vibrio parahaemolyticus]HCG5068868.1 retron St85 family RNA-directed DNA polymerase [Vibrio parahaemolyticus]HCG7907440.1 retron St85 family RNA-directed DNA polymerase [Vibrio parahaemolyticus]HCG8055104.1 retron St85 family RNA-directed DNA polymerase [Vibrio parahaemolyticus]HCG8058999.1 retron St85 family RNA-directed DNA polymerase [Vibrio parahaemolyticu